MASALSQRKGLITIIALVAIVALFPTSRTREIEELVETLDCTRTLDDGESLSAIWEFQGKHKIVTSITISEEIQVLFARESILMIRVEDKERCFNLLLTV